MFAKYQFYYELQNSPKEKDMDITALYQIFLGCTGITTDSRNCPEGSLFIALKGDTFNGNAFAAKALEAGSAYAVVDEAAYAPAGDTRYILVDNCLHTLQQLANITAANWVRASSALQERMGKQRPRSLYPPYCLKSTMYCTHWEI